ncbi:hypothetical protein QG053_10150, partial [Kingella kingae]|nr:hypothetical protein [Kingella kingae]MDK4565386.1 hypothetical protein [Kingella kingae]
CTRRSLSPCPNLNLIHYNDKTQNAGCFLSNPKSSLHFMIQLNECDSNPAHKFVHFATQTTNKAVDWHF